MIATTVGRAREALDATHGRINAWRWAPDPRAAVLRDVRHAGRTATLLVAWWYHVAAARLADRAGEEAFNAYQGWIRLGQAREREQGLTPEHPDSWYLSTVRGPHLESEPCNAECERLAAEHEHDEEES